ncbi:hypothetical protein WDW86_15870 [Bdellovibrionota bacterium FG-2]
MDPHLEHLGQRNGQFFIVALVTDDQVAKNYSYLAISIPSQQTRETHFELLDTQTNRWRSGATTEWTAITKEEFYQTQAELNQER